MYNLSQGLLREESEAGARLQWGVSLRNTMRNEVLLKIFTTWGIGTGGSGILVSLELTPIQSVTHRKAPT